jgi:Ni,Fe-hydrogenase III large subunit
MDIEALLHTTIDRQAKDIEKADREITALRARVAELERIEAHWKADAALAKEVE